MRIPERAFKLFRFGSAKGRSFFAALRFAGANRSLHNGKLFNGAIAEKAVDFFDDQRLKMLQFKGKTGIGAKMERCARPFSFGEIKPDRFRVPRHHRAHHVAPAQNNLALGKAILPEGFAGDSGHKITDSAHAAAPVVIFARFCRWLFGHAIDAVKKRRSYYAMVMSPAQRLLDWFDQNGRSLPWRAEAGVEPDPYRVWLAEIMLQQTTVAAVIPYYERFLVRWPCVQALAGAPREHILEEWAGLGYYARARNLHACANAIVTDWAGQFPGTEKELKSLPGIGDYTAAAIAAIAFNRRATVLDGNVIRVISRLNAVEEALPKARKKLFSLADKLTPDLRPGDYAGAIMDLGATVCTPSSPDCPLCPWRKDCLACQAGRPEDYPKKAPRKEKPTRRGTAFWLEAGGHVLLRRRPEKGLLGGMLEVPSSPWETGGFNSSFLAYAPAEEDWSPVTGIVTHTFTHFHLELQVMTAMGERRNDVDGHWVPMDRLEKSALPSVMQKIVRLVRGGR